MLRRKVLVILVLVAAFASSAHAEVLTWVMEGTVTSIRDDHDVNPFLKLGDPVRYTFSFESNPPVSSEDLRGTSYGGGLVSSLVLGTTSIDCGGPHLSVSRSMPGGPYDLFQSGSSMNSSALALMGRNYFNVFQPPSALPTFPTDPIAIGPDPRTEFGGDLQPLGGGWGFSFEGTLDRFYAVPEPATGLLLLFGCGLLAHRRRLF